MAPPPVVVLAAALLPVGLALLACTPERAVSADHPRDPERFADLRSDAPPTAPFEFPELVEEEGPSADVEPAADPRAEAAEREAREARRSARARAEARAESTAERRAVARIEVEPPAAERFVLRATLPVPADFPEPDADAPTLGIVDRWGDGGASPAQVQVVARRPDGSPEVVEVCAVVHGPDPEQAEDGPARTRFAVVRLDGREPPVDWTPPARVAERIPAAWLRARDVHGNVYLAELTGAVGHASLGSARVVCEGNSLVRERVHAVLVPDAAAGEGEGAPLAHLMGVHAYWTSRAESDAIALDLRVHNGLTAASGPKDARVAPAGIVYWDALELVLPRGWVARPLAADPALGAARREGQDLVLPLVAAQPDGVLHMMGPQGQLLRRLDLRPAGAARDGRPAQVEGLGFCVPGDGLWSWWDPAHPAWFPQRSALADWSEYRHGSARGRAALRARSSERLAGLLGVLATGEAGGEAAARMGWCQPLGSDVQGATGGGGIQFFEGHYAANGGGVDEVLALMLEERMTACRQPESQWTLAGDPAGVAAWLDDQGRVPFDFRTNGRILPPEFALPCLHGPAASAQVLEVVRRGLRPPYDRGTAHLPDGKAETGRDVLLNWMPHDGQHYSRATRCGKALVWCANDELARDELCMSAELFHLMYHEHPHVRASWSEGVTLRVHQRWVSGAPHRGLPIGRDQAWGIDAMCAAYSVSDPAWRAANRGWFTHVGRLFVDASMPNGLIERVQIPKMMEGRYAVSQAFEASLLLHAERTLLESVLRGQDPELVGRLEEQMQRGVDYLVFGPVFGCVKDQRSGVDQCGVRWLFAVAPELDFSVPPYCDVDTYGADYLPPDGLDGGVERLYIPVVLEYVARLSDGKAGPGFENRYLRRILKLGTGFTDFAHFEREFFARVSRYAPEEGASWEGLIAGLQERAAKGR